MARIQDFFRTHSYAVIRSLVEEPDLSFFCQYALTAKERGTIAPGDESLPRTPAAYGDPAMDTLLEKTLPKAEEFSEKSLYPAYSYFRVYQNGDELQKHTDRPACEISLSVCLGINPDEPWPIWMESNGKKQKISLGKGDAVLYRGIEVPHWRDQFSGDFAVHVFLHYVDQHGPNRDWKFDKRPALRVPIADRRAC